jgi:hypothetical protein
MLAALPATLLAAQSTADTATAQEEDLGRRLLQAAEGLQMPGSEADSFWWFVSYPGEEELPTAERMASLEGCARGFARLRDLFHRQYGHDLAVYRCDTNQYGEVRIYFLGLNKEGLSGLKTINIET